MKKYKVILHPDAETDINSSFEWGSRAWGSLLVSILSFWMRLVGSSRLISIKRRGRQTPRLSLRSVANSDYPPCSNDRVPGTAAMFGYFLTVRFLPVVLANSVATY